jgi:S-DNA-T family DNA segregation ATPase FtsK/SpoIIIE
VEFVYRIPLGLTFQDFQDKRQNIEDGLNHKRALFDLTLDDLKTLKLRADIFTQIKKLLNNDKQRKEVLLDYDGTLHVKIYREPMPEKVLFDGLMMDSCKGWSICMGYAREGSVYHDFDKIPHMVNAGTTRYGKSVFLKGLITTLINNHPEDVTFTLLDLKGGLAFNRFKNCKQVVTVAKNVEESRKALRAAHAAILARQAEYLLRGVEDVREAKERRRHFIVVDEGAELASKGEADNVTKAMKVECEHLIAEIARIGGGLGFRLIFATQYPTADTLPRQVKQNCDARLCFKIQTAVASTVVLDEAGAEDLPLIPGRGIYQTDRKLIVQAPYIDNEFIDRTIQPHITIRPRKEVNENEGSTAKETAARRSDTLFIEEAGLSNKKPTSKVTPFRRGPKRP